MFFRFAKMATPRTVAFHTLGCKLNYSETSSIGRLFEEAGYAETGFNEGADIYVINTCSVTDFADKKCRQIVRRALRKSPGARVIVIGCYAQLKPKEISEIPGVDMVLGAAEKFRILDFVDQLAAAPDKEMPVPGHQSPITNHATVHASEVTEANVFTHAFSFGDRTRSFLKVQDGCDYKCAFCTIPLARGASRSDTVESVVANAEKIAGMGVKEIVLTGVNIGDFGNGTDPDSHRDEGLSQRDKRPKKPASRRGKKALFIDLVRALDQVKGIDRIRISSIEPNLLTPEIIRFVAGSERFVPHFHMPLQSGNNKQLKMMRRRYRRELYAERVAWIKKTMPHCCIGVDVIVGFPGETEEDFLETYRFLNELDVSYLHVFTYSERANTLAAEMPGVVPMHIRRERNEMLTILSQKKRRLFYGKYVGQTRKVLLEKSKTPGLLSGFTDNYIKIELPISNGVSEEGLLNQIVSVRLEGVSAEGNMNAVLMVEAT